MLSHSLSPSLNVSIKLINDLFVSSVKLPNLDPWINPNEATNKFGNHLLSIKAERQKMIHPKSHPTYNERHEKVIDMIDWALERNKTNMEKNQQQNEQVIIDNIIEELEKKRDIAIHKMRKTMLNDEVSIYRLEENTLDYVLFRIYELTGRLI